MTTLIPRRTISVRAETHAIASRLAASENRAISTVVDLAIRDRQKAAAPSITKLEAHSHD
tara:strand:+ start:5594 stop:5773 length:180 start_codon:yes stop_codon:yes gene_type:complete